MPDCLFCSIVEGEIPADIVYENEHVLAFKDINPQAPYHALVIPRQHVATVADLETDGMMDELTRAANILARQEGIVEDGYRLVVNCNENGGQAVYHLHMHILGGRAMKWPPG
ncbi:MAG: histidine triad nucleotide-binding protein [Candidatus Latescibacteria bacterium]|jgi:histidine triad (HIT) family protein|nr:histidine triad nucleotide-binding protein [Candidatus Latescibacterota bacterium]